MPAGVTASHLLLTRQHRGLQAAQGNAGLLPGLRAVRTRLEEVTAQLDAWLGGLCWPSPRLGLLAAADLRKILAVPSSNPAALQPFFPLLSKGAHNVCSSCSMAWLSWPRTMPTTVLHRLDC